MLTVDADLSCLTVDELRAAREQLRHDLHEVEVAMAVRYCAPLTAEEKHAIAQALAVDEATGEWDAGA